MKDECCPKCGERILGTILQGLLEVDVVHSGETWEEARLKIVDAVDRAIANGHKGVKIIHGYGATSGNSRIRGRAVELLRGLANRTGGRLAPDRDNEGAHLLWLNR